MALWLVIAPSPCKCADGEVSPAASDVSNLDCARNCAHHCLLLCGIPVSPKRILQHIPANSKGNSMLEIQECLRAHGVVAEGRKIGFDALCKGGFPVILFVNENHFMVAEGLDEKGLRLSQQPGRVSWMGKEELLKIWSGDALRILGRSPRNKHALADKSKEETFPSIQFDTLYAFVGEVGRHGSREAIFSFRNEGDAPLEISSVQKDCKCTTVGHPEQRIQPGQSGEIRVAYHSEGSPAGSFQRQLLVRSNDPVNPLIPIYVAGVVYKEYEVKPAYRLDFGKLKRGQTRSLPLTVEWLNKKGVLNVDSTGPARIDRTSQERPVRAEERYDLFDVTVDASLSPEGPFHGDIFLKFGPQLKDDSHEITIRYRGEVISEFQRIPDSLFFGLVSTRVEATAELTLWPQYDTSWTFVRMETGGLPIKISLRRVEEDNCFIVSGILKSLPDDTTVLDSTASAIFLGSDDTEKIVSIPVFALKSND